MHKFLIVQVLGALIVLIGHVQARSNEESLSSPQAAVEAHYAGLKALDLDLLRKVHGDLAWVNKEEVTRLNALRLSYKIVAISPMENSRPGDVYIKVKEYFKNSQSPAVMHFELRRVHGSWMIINFNADEPPSEPPNEVVGPNRDRN